MNESMNQESFLALQIRTICGSDAFCKSVLIERRWTGEERGGSCEVPRSAHFLLHGVSVWPEVFAPVSGTDSACPRRPSRRLSYRFPSAGSVKIFSSVRRTIHTHTRVTQSLKPEHHTLLLVLNSPLLSDRIF